MIKQYQDKKYLYKKYWEEKLSTYQIGKLVDVDNGVIFYWLQKLNIPRRSISEALHFRTANHCKLSQEAVEWINGEILGDGCIRSQSIYSANFQYTSKHLQYIQYISDTLKSFGIKQGGKIKKYYDKIWGNIIYQYTSLDYVELLPIRKKWYPNGKKRIPKNIGLTSITLRQHYIGDGGLIKRKNHRPSIRLATNGFSISGVKLLVKKLINLGFKATRQPANNVIYISSHSTKNFLNHIGKCPINCYRYKWDY